MLLRTNRDSSVVCGAEIVPARTRSKKRPLLRPDVCRSTIRNIFLMYAYVVENRRKNWYTGASILKTVILVCLLKGGCL